MHPGTEQKTPQSANSKLVGSNIHCTSTLMFFSFEVSSNKKIAFSEIIVFGLPFSF